jgi:tetratricopeptide (TPR) repeat protein
MPEMIAKGLPKRILLCFAFSRLFFCPLLLRAADPAWYEVRSPHFRVLTDGAEKEGREVAREFEQMRAVFSSLYPQLKLDSGIPLLIIAASDEGSAKRLVPQVWKGFKNKPVGFFHHGWERQFALVRLDEVRRGSQSQIASNGYQVIYHEYTHSLLHSNFRWLPTWLDEGLAEFFASTRFEQKKVYVGAPSVRAALAKGRVLIPTDRLIEISGGARELEDSERVQVFYSQSWGLVHMLMVRPKGQSNPLQNFVNLLEGGMKQKPAFQQAIGDLGEIERQLRSYLDLRILQSMVLENPPQIDEETFVSRRLSAGDAQAEIGAFAAWLREFEAARPRVEDALKRNPDSAVAMETKAFLDFMEGKDADAAREFERAAQLDGTLYLSEYFKLMLSPLANADRGEELNAFRAALTRILEVNPNFAPAYVELAMSDLRQGIPSVALTRAQKALQLSPSRAGYHTLIAEILHRLGRDEEAALLVRYIAERWQGFDRDEAVALWENLPEAVRTGEPLTMTPPKDGMRTISGKITSVECREKEGLLSVVLDGSVVRLRAETNSISGGISDTLWYGPDHFSFCHHLEGLQGVLHYKPPSNPTELGELSQFNVKRVVPTRTATSTSQQ